MQSSLLVRDLGLVEYVPIWEKMRNFTEQRKPDSQDELWLLQHKPVFTQGRRGNLKDIIRKTAIPVVQSDRGGQITYHGPGQLIVYLLLDLKHFRLGVKSLVSLLENSIVELLTTFEITAELRAGAPGVYVNARKIAALGLRIRKNCTLHGLSLNIDMDLTPFAHIDPCGYENLEVCQIKDYVMNVDLATTGSSLVAIIQKKLREHVSKAK